MPRFSPYFERAGKGQEFTVTVSAAVDDAT